VKIGREVQFRICGPFVGVGISGWYPECYVLLDGIVLATRRLHKEGESMWL